MSQKINRRTFAKTSAMAAATLSALSASRVVGANDRIRLGFIGVANRGGQLLSAYTQSDFTWFRTVYAGAIV